MLVLTNLNMLDIISNNWKYDSKIKQGKRMSAIEKSLDILEAVLAAKGEISIADLAKVVDQSISTTHRICLILVKRGYLYQENKGSKYSLGYKFLIFNDITYNVNNIRNAALPFIKDLSKKISETVVLAVWDGFEPVDILFEVPDTILKATPGLGTKSPLHCTAMGKIFLANMPEEIIEKNLHLNGLPAFTDRTITDIEKLKAELDIILKEELAFDDEEYIIGVKSVAAPIRSESGEILAGICFLGPSSRINTMRMKQLAPFVKNCASAISMTLGYGREDKDSSLKERGIKSLFNA